MWWWKVQQAALRHVVYSAVGAGVLQTLGVAWLFIQLTSFLWPHYAEAVRAWSWWGLAVAALVGIWCGWPRLSAKSNISGTDAILEMRVCNMFEQDGVFVVSSNTTFDTTIEDGTISRVSTQGQYTERFCDTVANLDRQIGDSLEGIDRNVFPPGQKPYGKQDEYPLGTVADVRCNGKRAYFVAFAGLDRNRVANATKEQILDALPKLWEFVRARGGLEPITIPIVGSGFSRTNATREELIREIAKSFIAAAREGRFCEHLTIAISPDDFREKDIDLQVLGRFLEHECTYDSGAARLPLNGVGDGEGGVVHQERGVGGVQDRSGEVNGL